MREPAFWFDLTASFRWRRAPTGITRVEQECCRRVLEVASDTARFCVYDEQVHLWYEMPIREARAVLARAYTPDGAAVVATISDWVPRSGPIEFIDGDSYLCLNADQTPQRLQALYAARQRGVRIYGIAYDIIQILHPHFYWDGADQGASRYFVDLAWTARHVFCISERTRRDLLAFYERVQAPVPATSVIRLGDALPTAQDAACSAEVQEILRQPYILVVGTLEIRKNHETLYRAVLDLLDRGQEDLPTLVFAGMRGWRVDDLLASLQGDVRVQRRIRLLHHASDVDLAALYRNCLFTAFPSFYEGWGLPVAESLVYGKFCLASDSGAIPEIAPDLIEMLSPYDVRAWADRMLFYSRNPAALAAREVAIAARYPTTDWRSTADTIMQRLAADGAVPGAREFSHVESE